MSASPWLHRLRSDARVRLFCLPAAGGGSTPFLPWRGWLAPDVELCPVLLPGRETRLREPPLTEMSALVSAVADGLGPAFDRPYALLGYSLGGLIAFELARELRRRGVEPPQRLLVVARSAPDRQEQVAIGHLPDDAFVAALQDRYAALPPQVVADPEMMEIFLPVLRADFSLLEGYRHVAEAPLEVPIAAWFGTMDRTLTHERVAAWEHHTSAAFELHALDAGHFFQRNARLVRRIDALLR
ncbi:thioesterase II family protein [Paraliomyxa miuraensis]|uniref:thioesterase II family protein n=1 Tax=Paraliomyxa miuraensis TaxID=376150 RepID=UPI002251552A|nr:thioesterase domain-containing protein [Paraliomyxa miuraensis]MCX4246652.1 thioesterase domain-containing protein [Paraliomyxa miuraensis]